MVEPNVMLFEESPGQRICAPRYRLHLYIFFASPHTFLAALRHLVLSVLFLAVD